MADAAAQNVAAKARIISHLNKDHQRSLSYYLQHYNSLSSFEARSPVLTDITFDYMTFRTSWGNTSSIPLSPPMKAWSEARTRTVEMDRVSRKALGISHISLTEYELPNSLFQRAIFALCILTVVIFATKQRIVKGTFVYDRILPYWPGGPEWFLWISNVIALPTLILHLGEAFLLDRTRLRKYGVERGSSLWFKWVISCFIEGFGCFVRIDKTVKRKELEAEKQKH